ncbi:MAG: hypothetical protein Q4G05_06435 [Clostridia bacterium]|nr:hypothetical protein [Clostridia bacterium]
MEERKMSEWITTMEAPDGSKLTVSTFCEVGSNEDNAQYWNGYWKNFIKIPDNADNGWLGYVVIKSNKKQ